MPPMYHITTIISEDNTDRKAPLELERFQNSPHTVGRNSPAELMVNAINKASMMSWLNQAQKTEKHSFNQRLRRLCTRRMLKKCRIL